jgi:hypothetical protein
MVLEGGNLRAAVGVEAVAVRLRAHLCDDPPNVAFDENCEHWLDLFLAAAAREETKLLPRRMQRALEQMTEMTHTWENRHLTAETRQPPSSGGESAQRPGTSLPTVTSDSTPTWSARHGGTWYDHSSSTSPSLATIADTFGCATSIPSSDPSHST